MKKRTVTVGAIAGALISASILFLLAGVTGKALVDGKIGEGNVERIAPLLLFAASTIGCTTTTKLVGIEMKTPVLVAVINLIIVTCCSLILDGPLQNAWRSLLAILFSCTIACMICMKKPARNVKRKKHYR